MLAYLLFGTHEPKEPPMNEPPVIDHDDAAHPLLLDQETLAQIEGKEALIKNHHYRAVDFLRRFKRDVLPDLWWSAYNHRTHQARTVLNDGLDRETKAAVARELHRIGGERVYFISGVMQNQGNRHRHRQSTRDESLKLLDQAGCQEAHEIGVYLAALPIHRFTVDLDHLQAAQRIIHERAKTEASRRRQLSILRAIEDQPQPFNAPRRRSVRLFPLNDSIGLVMKEARRALKPEWIEFDLRNSQLAICAALWGVPLVQNFLATGQSLWTELFRFFDLPESDEVKRIFKRFTYGLLFGMGRQKLQRQMTDQLRPFGIPKGGLRFLRHPIMRAMLHARNDQIAEIEARGGAYDCFGNWMECSQERRPHQILAAQAQAVELKLIYPAFALAMSTNEFVITLYQYDGFSVEVRQASRRAAWIDRIIRAVNESIRQTPIITSLECDQESGSQRMGSQYIGSHNRRLHDH